MLVLLGGLFYCSFSLEVLLLSEVIEVGVFGIVGLVLHDLAAYNSEGNDLFPLILPPLLLLGIEDLSFPFIDSFFKRGYLLL